MSKHEVIVESLGYPIVLERGPNSFGAYCPALPGCVAAGHTEEQTLRLMAGAMQSHLAAMRRDGDRIPAPHRSRQAVAV